MCRIRSCSSRGRDPKLVRSERLIAARLMSPSGIFRTWRDVRSESAFRGKADSMYSEQYFAF